MDDFEQEMMPDCVILHALSRGARKYALAAGFYRKFYNEDDDSVKFELPRQRPKFEEYRRRLIAAKLTIREKAGRAASAQ
jgi:hypothetical protein